MPVSVLTVILNLAEFLEREEDLKLFSSTTLAGVAKRCNAGAKGLYYKEKEFDKNRYENMDALISLNFDLQQPEAANGLLKLMNNEPQNDMVEDWYLKLHEWNRALSILEEKKDTNNLEDVLGKLECYSALSDWEKVSDTVEKLWEEEKRPQEIVDNYKVSEFASYASWNLKRWDKFQEYTNKIHDKDPYQRNFFQSVIFIQQNKFKSAEKCIDKCRELIDPKMKSRAIDQCMLELQYLKELEEIIEYKTVDDEGRKKHLEKIWCKRLHFMIQDIGPIQKVLNLRSLVIDISEDTTHYLELADLCTKKGNAPMCQRILQNLKTGITESINVGKKDHIFRLSQVDFGMLKYEYSQGDQNKALEGLKFLIENEEKIDPLWYITLGKWNKEMKEREKNLNDEEFRKIISYFKKATELDETDNLAWHHYALANYEACKHFESFASPSKKGNHHLVTEYVFYVMFAVKGLIQSISLGGQDVTKTLQDTLRLLKLWFKHGSVEEIDNQVKNGFDIIGVEVWTQVIPQLLARIDINAAKVKKTMVHLLKIICDTYPQAMIYPVSVLSQSNTDNKKQVADELIEIMRKNQKELINQALFISKELVRAAVLMNESWCEALEEAASNYFASNNSEKMIEILEKQYKTLEDEPQSMSEIAFHQIYKCELLEAWDWINKPNRTDDDFLMAWDIYHKLFLRLSKKLKEVDFYELKNIAPKLLEIENSTISVPGLYRCNQNIISIYKFAPSLTVLKSKQLPRKISMYGSDGKEYGFLLKGREDIRQDERAMQLFGLVNTLLSVDPVTQRKDLSIKRYSIIPLSFNAGLLGWVPNSDTLNQLITKYREANKVIPRVELMMIEKT